MVNSLFYLLKEKNRLWINSENGMFVINALLVRVKRTVDGTQEVLVRRM